MRKGETSKKNLTDRTLKALKSAKAGQRYEIADAVVPGLRVRVYPTAKKTFVLLARYPGDGKSHPTRRELGAYGALTLEQARIKARKWIELIGQGKNPKAEEEKAKKAELRKQKHTFTSVAEDYFADPEFEKKRSKRVIKRDIKKELVSAWAARPITDIEPEDVKTLIKGIRDRPAPYMAHLVLAYTKALFNWAIDAGDYGLETSPCDRIRPKTLIGQKAPRQRVLTDTEIGALWRASEGIDYPFGSLYRLLLLTGCRLDEVGGGHWREIDLAKKLWVIPSERFKSDVSHLVPLTAQAVDIIEALPRFAKGDCLFSTTWGEKPVSGFSKAKARLDKAMAAELGKIEPWRVHDIRRTVRTKLASLRVPDTVAEIVIGHGKRGLQRVYDQHQYEKEMREALELWAGKLRDIVTPPPENVTKFPDRAAAQ
jgi:integrase